MHFTSGTKGRRGRDIDQTGRISRLAPSDVQTRRDELLTCLTESLRASPIQRHTEYHLRGAEVELVRACDYPASYHVLACETADHSLIGLAIASRTGENATLPGDIEGVWPGFGAASTLLIWVAVLPNWRRAGHATRLMRGSHAKRSSAARFLSAMSSRSTSRAWVRQRIACSSAGAMCSSDSAPCE